LPLREQKYDAKKEKEEPHMPNYERNLLRMSKGVMKPETEIG